VTAPLVRGWQQYWFAPKDALTLAACRLLYFALLFWNYYEQPFAPWAQVPRAWWQPIWVFDKFNIPVLSEPALYALEIIWKTSLAMACVGLLARVSTMTAFVGAFYLLGLRHNWGKASHDDASTVLILGILALSRCGDALSIDALIRRWWRGRKPARDGTRLPLESGEYRWPLRGVWLILAMVFFNSAVAKLRKSGLEWMLSDNLALLMVRLNYFNNPTTDWGLRLANIPGFGQFMAVSAIGVELLFPLVLFSRLARWILVPTAFLMQLGNKFLLGVDFTSFMFAYAFFIDWQWLFTRLGILRKRATTTDAPGDVAVAEPVHAQSSGQSIFDRRAQVHRVPPPPASPL
jgi:hypothetical protein